MAGFETLPRMYPDSRVGIKNLSEDLISYLPKSKHDLESIRQLRKLEHECVLPLLPHLLTWIQDSNWPIANEMGGYLLNFGKEIIPEIKWVFEGAGNIWKFNCIGSILMKLPLDIISPLKPFLERMANQPTQSEIAEDVQEIAIDCLARFN